MPVDLTQSLRVGRCLLHWCFIRFISVILICCFIPCHFCLLQNSAYRADEDEIYLYGSMTFGTRQNWQLQSDSLTLLDHLMEGKFANIFKASLRAANSNKTTVVAKLLKSEFSSQSSLLQHFLPFSFSRSIAISSFTIFPKHTRTNKLSLSSLSPYTNKQALSIYTHTHLHAARTSKSVLFDSPVFPTSQMFLQPSLHPPCNPAFYKFS